MEMLPFSEYFMRLALFLPIRSRIRFSALPGKGNRASTRASIKQFKVLTRPATKPSTTRLRVVVNCLDMLTHLVVRWSIPHDAGQATAQHTTWQILCLAGFYTDESDGPPRDQVRASFFFFFGLQSRKLVAEPHPCSNLCPIL